MKISEGGYDLGGIMTRPPAGYLEMISLIDGAHAVVTDSGGIQEETTVLNVPCFTLRENTERPITIQKGTNQLVPNPRDLPGAIIKAHRTAQPCRIEGWDGKAAIRIVAALRKGLQPVARTFTPKAGQ